MFLKGMLRFYGLLFFYNFCYASSTSSPGAGVCLEPPDAKCYLVWQGDDVNPVEFSSYKGKTVGDVMDKFEGVMVKGEMQLFV